MKLKANLLFKPTLLQAAAALFAASTAAHATDYSFGSVTESFTLTATDHARAFGTGTSSGIAFHDNGWGSVYDRGSDQDATYMHFDLSSLAVGTINGTVNLNLTIDAAYGGAINSGVVGSASSAWSYPGNTPGITTISGADPSGTYTTGQVATAVIDNTTFQGFVTNPSTFHGFGITAGDGSGAVFSGPATLTGNATTGLIRVVGGTDWSAAVWNGGTLTLSISGTSDLSGGNVAVRSGATLAVTDSATLGAGNFSGTFANNGALSFGSSANQTLGGNITGTGSLTKTGTGTMTLSAANTYTGATTISTGTLALQNTYASPGFSIASGAALELNVASGDRDFATATFSGAGTLRKTGGGRAYWGAGAATFTLGAGAMIDVQEGTLSVGSYANDSMSGSQADLNIAAGATFDSAACAASVNALTGAGTIILAYNNDYPRTMTVGVNNGGGTFSGTITDGTFGGNGNLVKTGSGTQTLSGANTYSGTTTVNGGKLVINGNISTSSLTTVKTGATLGGSGTVGALTVEAGAFLTPGNSPGILSTGTYNQAGTLSLELNGTTAGTAYDQVNVTGTVTLSGALAATVGYTPVNGDLLFILLNDGTDAISGTLSGLAQGDTVSFSGFDWKISYNADSTTNTFTGTLNGNDIALMAVPEPGAALLGGLGMLALLRRRRA